MIKNLSSTTHADDETRRDHAAKLYRSRNFIHTAENPTRTPSQTDPREEEDDDEQDDDTDDDHAEERLPSPAVVPARPEDDDRDDLASPHTSDADAKLRLLR